MSISVRTTSTGPNNQSTTTTISLPTGTTTGDLTILFGSQNVTAGGSAATVTIPSGWTSIYNANGQFACYRLWQSGDPSSVTVSSTLNAWWHTGMITYIGCDATTPIDVSNGFLYTQSGGQESVNGVYRVPSVNPTYQNDLLVAIVMYSNASSVSGPTTPSGWTSRLTASGGPNFTLYDKQLSSSAATGDLTVTWSATTTSSGFFDTSIMIALHASGDTAATQAQATVIWNGFHAITVNTSSGTFLLDRLGTQTGDLVVIWGAANTGTLSAPSGYTTKVNSNNCFLLTRTYQNGDTNPTLTYTSAGFIGMFALVLRMSCSAGGVPTIGSINTATGAGTATIPSETPLTSYDKLLGLWAEGTTSTSTWTPPSTLTTWTKSGFGPDFLVADIQPASNPTGTYTASTNQAGTTMVGATMLVSPSSVTLTLTGVSATASVGFPQSAQYTQTALPAFPFPVSVKNTGIYQYATPGSILDSQQAPTAINSSPSLTGVAATSAAGTLATGPSIALTGVSSSSAVGSFTDSISVTLTGVETDSAVGSPSVIHDGAVTLTGVETDSAIGTLTIEQDAQVTLTGVETDSATGVPTVEIDLDVTVTGVETDSSIGDLTLSTVQNVSLTGVETDSAHGTLTLEVDTNPALTGVQTVSTAGTPRVEVDIAITGVEATSGIGTPIATLLALAGQVATVGIGTFSVETGSNELVGVQSTVGIGSLHAQATGNFTNVSVSGVHATSGIGTVTVEIGSNISEALTGVQATVQVGNLLTSKYVSGGLTITDIACDAFPNVVDDHQVTLSWSDTDGQSWSDSVRRSIGQPGQYLNPQWRRLGMSRRGRVFQLEWSCTQPTALQGCTIMFEDAST